MKKILLISSIITVVSIAYISSLNNASANSSAPPNATAGAPSDAGGATCTNCHAGTATQTTGVISSNIPGSGYIGGTTYSVSVTMSGSSAYGFELTPQTATSNVGLGTWIAGVGTGISGKYIKHAGKKTGASAVWTFSWTAPTTATSVTFYGSFNYSNNNGGTSGDIIKTSSVTYLANTTGIEDYSVSKNLIAVFPNPTTEILHITSTELFEKGFVYSIDGKLIKVLSEQELLSKTISVIDFNTGIYYLQVSSNEKNLVAKFSKN